MTQLADLEPTAAVTIRGWRAGDVDLVRAAAAELSPYSFYTRFFTGGRSFPHGYLELLASAECVVAEVAGRLVGWAEVVRLDDPPYAGELGVLVVDEWQGRGLGPRLARAAMAAARRRGVSVVLAHVLDSNLAARRAIRGTFGRGVEVRRDEGVLRYVLPAVGPAASSPS